MKIKSNKLPKKKYPSNLFAFGMIELSSVAFIIGILIGGIVTAQKLVSLARLSTARVLTKSSPVHTVEDLVMWLETTSTNSFDEDERIDGASVATWYDINQLSVSKIDVSQSTSTKQPLYIESAINGLPALRFDGSDYLEGDFVVIGDEITAFIVTKRSAIVTNTTAFTTYKSANGADNASTDSFIEAWESSGTKLITFRNGSKSQHTHPGNDIPYIFTTRFDGTNNIAYLNGTAATSVSSSGNFDIDKLLVGGRYTGSSAKLFYKGDIGEIIIYERALLSYEIDQIEEYLSEKWKIDLD